MKSLICLVTLISLFMGSSYGKEVRDVINLQGQWAFRLDPENIGLQEKWYLERLPDTVRLPGSLDEQGIGMKFTRKNMGRLTRETQYIGPAWYQKEVEIPDNWNYRRITLYLERACWETQVYVDGFYADTRNSLSAPHDYDLTDLLTPGRHTLTIRVDNTVKINIGHTLGNMMWSHAISEETQTNWNGIIGEISLRAKPGLNFESVKILPDFKKRVILFPVILYNATGIKQEVILELSGCKGRINRTDTVSVENGSSQHDFEIPFGEDPVYWDEFSPNTEEWQIRLAAKQHVDTLKFRSGLREFVADGQHFRLNGRKIFLRGKVESAVFPLTGYAPMTLEAWLRMMHIYREYGLNHLRFHSWCPPEAAFQAADEMGFILHIELPLWDGYGMVGSIPERATFLIEEANRIIETYGNHPSFCLMSMGNELGTGNEPFLAYLVGYLQKKDPRRLYTSTTHPSDPMRKDDYFVTAATERGDIRGILPFGDFGDKLESMKDRPVLTHELGQATMYPDFRDTVKYTGHLKPYYLQEFRRNLADHHMLDQAEDFRKASGALMVEIYKENVEAQLRTSNVAGFQMLDIQDYPGHGMAVIGVMDAFLNSKGLIEPNGFRRFCSPSVPLIRARGFTWTNDETFSATGELAHFGKVDLINVQPVWLLRDHKNRIIQSGNFGFLDIPTGQTTFLGEIQVRLENLKIAEIITLEISVPGTLISNSWKFWVYPAKINTDLPSGIYLSKRWDEETRNRLMQGGKVLFLPDSGTLVNVEKSRWHPVFWSYQLFKQPVTMGILCDPEDPALKDFPTDSHADWQWRSLLDHSEALVLDSLPSELRPIVQFIPDFNINKKLSALFEVRVGKGRLLVSTIELTKILDTCPEARQLMNSLIRYMDSSKFNPEIKLDLMEADRLFLSSGN